MEVVTVGKQMLLSPAMSCTHGGSDTLPKPTANPGLSANASTHTGLCVFLPYRRRMDNKRNFIIPVVFLMC